MYAHTPSMPVAWFYDTYRQSIRIARTQADHRNGCTHTLLPFVFVRLVDVIIVHYYSTEDQTSHNRPASAQHTQGPQEGCQWSSDLRQHPKLLLGEELRERGADKEGAASGRDAAQARCRVGEAA